MGAFFVYIMKSSICLVLFYLIYRWLLSKETFHRFNRIALLSLLVFSFLVPCIKITMQEVPEVSQPFLALEESMQMVEINHLDVLGETPVRFHWNALILQVYVVGVFFFIMRHLWSSVWLVRLLHACRKEKMEDGVTLYVHQAQVAPFSWMKVIAISEEDLVKHGEAILTHERAHIRNGHSWDLLFAQACTFVQWFNPVAWLLKKELQVIHEYEADEFVLLSGMDGSTYQLSIIERVVGTRLFTIANSFNRALLTKRIAMMNKDKSHPWARLKFLFVLPLVALALIAFARPGIISIPDASFQTLPAIAKEEKALSPKGEETELEKMGEEIHVICEEMPEFPGGWNECIRFIQQHLQYPSDALAEGIEGRVTVRMVIRKDGSVDDIKILKSVHPSLDREAARVIKLLKCQPGRQKGEPVNTYFQLPVWFRLKNSFKSVI